MDEQRRILAQHPFQALEEGARLVPDLGVGGRKLAAIGEGGADVKFSIRRNDVAAPPYGERRTAVPPVDPLWVRAHQEAEQKMKKIEQLVVSSAEGHEQASEAAAAIAVDPGKGGAEAIDPQKANTFALSFHH